MEAKDALKKATKEALSQLGTKDVEFHLEHPENPAHGDYSTNVAIRMGGKPLENAKKMAEAIRKMQYAKRWLEKIEVAGPGFINFWLSNEAFSRELALALKEQERYGGSKIGSGKTLVVDHSHPNIAKRFGVGHLRSTVIGQAIVKLYRFLGFRVIADNFLGDWGTQFGMIIAKVKRSKLKVQNLTIDDFERLYVEFNKAAKQNPALWEQARSWFKRLEEGDKEALEIWEEAREQSLKEFERIWELLGVKFDYIHGESFFQDKMDIVISEAKKKRLATKDKGALIVRIPAQKTPLILVKSDGATTYETRDLAAIRFWMQEFSPEKIVYEVGVDQDLHFRLVFGVAELLGYGKLNQFVHVKHGLYLSPSGQRFATRRGETVKLEEVLEEAIKRARSIIKARPSNEAIEQPARPAGGLSNKEREAVAQAVGIGAVKYFDLSHHPTTDIIFDWKKVFVLAGNSAPYLQYTYARTQSVRRKSQITNHKSQNNWKLESEELALLRTFYKFPEVVAEAAQNFSPNLLCSFLFDLAQKYNALYNKYRIIGNPMRLAINQVTGNILKTGLGLLGIETPSKM